MLEKLFRMIEEAHKGMCIMVEYYHVIDYVVSIYKTPALIEDNSPLIRTEGSLESATAEAYLLLEQYLNELTDDEKQNTERMYIDYKTRKVGEPKDATEF